MLHTLRLSFATKGQREHPPLPLAVLPAEWKVSRKKKKKKKKKKLQFLAGL